jgi:hypothetical protein
VICFDNEVSDNVPHAGSRAGRRLLAVLILAGCAVVLGPLSAQAADCPPAHTADQTKEAAGVFTGTVTDSRSGRADGSRTTTYDVEVDRVYKGDVKTATVEVTTDRGATGLDLTADKEYVFFVEEDGGALTSDGCSGTARASGDLVSKVEKLLGEGRSPVPPEPVHAVFTPVADAKPTSLPRLAAPGAALVLAGLLGLIVVRRVGRRSS